MVTSTMRRYNSLSISGYLRLTTASLFGGGGGVAPQPPTTTGVIANRFQIAERTNTTQIIVGYTSRRHHWSHPMGSVTNIQCLDTHWYIGTGPVAPPNPRTIKRYIEYPVGVFHQVMWSAAGTLTLSAGSYKSDVVLSSVTGLPLIIPAATEYWERTTNVGASVAIGSFPTIVLPAPTNTLGAKDGNSNTDLSNSGTIAVTTTANSFGSAAMIGTINAANARSFMLFGDSIMYGTGDNTSVGPKGGTGWAARMLDVVGHAYVKMGKPSQTAYEAITGGSLLADFAALCPFSEVIEEHGINDVRLNSSQTKLLADHQAVYAVFPGRKIWQTTLTPRTTSTDAWATVVNQTPQVDGNMDNLNPINNAIRAKPANVYGIIDAADAAMTARDSKIWTAAAVADGTHPNSTKCAAMAAYLAPQLNL